MIVADGKATFKRLPAGRYRLTASGSQGEMEVLVPGQAVVTWTPVEMSAMRARVTDSDGAIAQAGFMDGDLVIGVDGEEFTEQKRMYALWSLARTSKNTTVTVLRGGKRITITADLRKMIGRTEAKTELCTRRMARFRLSDRYAAVQ